MHYQAVFEIRCASCGTANRSGIGTERIHQQDCITAQGCLFSILMLDAAIPFISIVITPNRPKNDVGVKASHCFRLSVSPKIAAYADGNPLPAIGKSFKIVSLTIVFICKPKLFLAFTDPAKVMYY